MWITSQGTPVIKIDPRGPQSLVNFDTQRPAPLETQFATEMVHSGSPDIILPDQATLRTVLV